MAGGRRAAKRELAPARLAVLLLGAVEAAVEGVVVALGGVKGRALLAMLAVNAGRVVSVEERIDGVWGEDAPTTVRSSIQVHVSALRRALRGSGDELLVAQRPGYR